MAEIKLFDVLGGSFSILRDGLRREAGEDVAEQLTRTAIPIQKLGGDQRNFSFMAFPLPRSTVAERKNIPFVDESSYVVLVSGARFQINLDHFGQINWFYVGEGPKFFSVLTELLIQGAQNGVPKPFWEY